MSVIASAGDSAGVIAPQRGATEQFLFPNRWRKPSEVLSSKMLGSIEPELLGHAINSISEGLALGAAKSPPGLFSLVQKLGSKESRRGLSAAAEILETFGRRLGSPERKA